MSTCWSQVLGFGVGLGQIKSGVAKFKLGQGRKVLKITPAARHPRSKFGSKGDSMHKLSEPPLPPPF
eukprot:5664911-Amphidinium_carterae.1